MAGSDYILLYCIYIMNVHSCHDESINQYKKVYYILSGFKGGPICLFGHSQYTHNI